MLGSNVILMVCALFVTLGIVHAEAPEWEARYLETIRQHEGDNSQLAIEKLSTIVSNLSRKAEDRQSPAFKLARENLMQIPGFAEYLRQKILDISAWENGESTVQTFESTGKYFDVLSALPHPESVRILGEFLQDDRDPSKGAITDTRYVTNSVNAAHHLHRIGLEKMPVGGEYGNARDDLPTWRLWYEQVRHGKPFSFNGDPKVYTLASKSTDGGTRKERRANTGNAPTQSATGRRDGQVMPAVILALLLLIVTLAVLRFTRKSIKD